MKSNFLTVIIIAMFLLLVFSTISENPLYHVNWALCSVIILGLAMLAFFWSFEKSEAVSKEVVLIATMASLAAISRVPFVVIMGLQPTTFIVMITGYVFGTRTGFMVGAVAALVSNFFLGQGPWTPWQMFCWGMCGVAAGLLAGRDKEFQLIKFTVLGGICGYLFGWTMNIWHWVGFIYPLTLKTFLATYIASIAFDTLHALGNIVFSMIFGRSFYNVLMRFKKKILVRFLASDNLVK
ncbi:MAG: ECF transporter S component [Syntrophomonadaceae bacterium]|nr:ECF transporter S component [Syntrophomonadaceae bacterium]MDD4549540.1 ECF transporter S component [Syntrophomonadaceae bacterium]